MTSTRSLGSACCAALLSLAAALPLPARAQSVSATADLDSPVVLADRAGPVYLLLQLKAALPEASAARPRPPLNVALVIDRSGSMAERGKIEYAREAAKRVVDLLAPGDQLAIVEYDDRITVLREAALLSDPEAAKLAIDALRPRGSTNLASGLLAGAEQLVRHPLPGAPARVVLLSDGLANQGIVEPERIAAEVARVHGQGVRVTAMGLGASFNEDLMQLVAATGGGKYYFVDEPVRLARLFSEELSLTLAAVTRDARLELQKGDALGAVEVLGYPAKPDGRSVYVTQPDLFGGETRSVLVRLVLPALPEGRHELGAVVLRYHDLVNGKPQEARFALAVEASPDAARVQAARNARVAAESELLEAERTYSDAVRRYERGDKQGALKATDDLAQRLEKANVQYQDVRIAKKTEALRIERKRMDLADTSAEARSKYLKASKQASFATLRGVGSLGTTGSSTLLTSSRGVEVERLQKALQDKGFYKGPIDGTYTSDLVDAVRAFQLQAGLDPDGIAGPATLSELGLY